MGKLDNAISQIQNRWLLNRLCLLGVLAFFCFTSFYISNALLRDWLVGAAPIPSVLLSSWVIFQKRLLNRIPSKSDAARYLDSMLGTKERILTVESERGKPGSEERIFFIQSQIEDRSLLGVVPPWEIPGIFKVIFVSAFFALLSVIIWQWNQEKSTREEILSLIDNVVQNEQLPETVRDTLENLAEAVSTEKLSGEEVKAALEEAKSSVESALSGLNKDGDANGAKQINPNTPTPTPTATPQGSKDVKSKEADNQNTKSQNSQSKNSEDSKQGDKGGDGQGDEGKKGGDSKESSSDSGGQSSDKNSAQGGDSQQPKKENDSQKGDSQSGKTRKDGNKNDNGDSDSQSPSNNRGENRNSKGDSKSDKKDQGNSGAEAASSALNKIEQKIQSASGASQQGTDSQNENESKEGKDSQLAKDEKKGDPSDKKNNGQSEGNDGDKNQNPPSDSKNQDAKDKKKGESPRDQGSEGNKRSDPKGQNDSSSPAQDSSLGSARERQEEPGKEGDGGEHKRSIKETMVGDNDEKLDTTHTSSQSEKALSKEEARPKTSLSDITASKPVGVSAEEKQPIPQEYREMIR